MTNGKIEHDEAKLPKWAQDRLSRLRGEVERLGSLENAHAVLQARDWFTLPGPHDADERPRSLWILDKDSPFAVCSLSHGDTLLVGREKEKALLTPSKEKVETAS